MKCVVENNSFNQEYHMFIHNKILTLWSLDSVDH